MRKVWERAMRANRRRRSAQDEGGEEGHVGSRVGNFLDCVGDFGFESLN